MGSIPRGFRALADLALYQGRISEAVRIFEKGVAAELAAKNPRQPRISL